MYTSRSRLGGSLNKSKLAFDFSNYPKNLDEKVLLAIYCISLGLGNNFKPPKTKPTNIDNNFLLKKSDVDIKKLLQGNIQFNCS